MSQYLDYINKNFWKTIPSYPSYEASYKGHVRVKATKQPVSENETSQGYFTVHLRKVYGRSLGVHHVVCEAFHGKRPSKKHVAAHWDGDKKNNKPRNLRWATYLENGADTIRQKIERRKDAMGEKNLPAHNS